MGTRAGHQKSQCRCGTTLFKGNGFYITDYRSEGYKSAAKQEAGGKESGAKESGGGEKPAAKPAAKPETKPTGRAGPRQSRRPQKMMQVRRLRSTVPDKSIRRTVATRHQSCSWLQPFFWPACSTHGQSPAETPLITRSVSGQFVATPPAHFSWLFQRPDIIFDTNLVRLDPALLAVAAERFKAALWRQVGLKADSPWQGKIHLLLRPADSPEDDVTIASSLAQRTWDYQVILPDVLSQARYARALSAVLLLEIANRNNVNTDRSAEIPAWLVDGLAQLVMDENRSKLLLTLPAGQANSAAMSTLDVREHGLDALASAREPLHQASALTFEELSWPSDEQLNGDDGGAYRASAQLFVYELLRLPKGPEKMRALLTWLPECLNWQLAFDEVYRRDFREPASIEKWWSLRVVDFAAHNPTSQWTAADSEQRLATLLRVPVQIRGNSNSLPAHAEISMQNAIRELAPGQRDDILAGRLRELELEQFQMARPFAVLAAAYGGVLKDYLGESNHAQSSRNDKHASAPNRASVTGTLRKLDVLDVRRRELTARLHLNFEVGDQTASRNPGGQLDSR